VSPRDLMAGADIGGTFTDLVIIDRRSGETVNVKTLTTPHDPAEGVLTAVHEGLGIIGAAPSDIRRFVHATTLPTNLVLERKGARVAFVTTEGFGDMFAISRQHPSGPERFDLRWERPPSLIERELTIEARERLDARGSVLRPLDEADLAAKLEKLAPLRPEAFAVCLLHAYQSGAHEQQVAALIAKRFPDAFVSLSSEVWPEFREYERASATVLSAYVGPTFAAYVERLSRRLEVLGVPARLQIMQSSGAIMSASEAARRAAYAIESGPAAGVIAAAHVGRACGRRDVISFDMGGTTAKAGLVIDGRPGMASEFRVGGNVSTSGQREAGEPIRIPVIDLAEVGAGGGSIAWVDAGGHLRLGPRSAGARPGPACYDLGGVEATVTDANVVLGYLDARYFNGGKMTIRPELSLRAIEEKIAAPLGLSTVDAARGIYDLANALMGAAIRMVTLQRGIDPRDHAVVAFGGAGPLHIVQLAQQFGLKEVIVPPSPGVKSAYGLLISDVAYDAVRTVMTPVDGADVGRLNAALDALSMQVSAMLAEEISRGAAAVLERSLDLAFAHKFQTTSVRIGEGSVDADVLTQAERDYRREQHRIFGVESSDRCRIMGVRVRAVAPSDPAPPPLSASAGPSASAAIKYARRAWFQAAGGFVETPVYDRSKLGLGHDFTGPAIIEDPDATTICPPGTSVSVDAQFNLVIRVDEPVVASTALTNRKETARERA
jgi:N-methylhydantoinase A